MKYFLALFLALPASCELTGWNLDNFVEFSPFALWLVCPAFVLVAGCLGGLDFCRNSRVAASSSRWYMQRCRDPAKWRTRLYLSVAVAMLIGGGGIVYGIGLVSAFLPSTTETRMAHVVWEGKAGARALPICKEYLQLNSAVFGRFMICISKPRGQQVFVDSRAKIHEGAIVNMIVKRSVLGVYVIRVEPAI